MKNAIVILANNMIFLNTLLKNMPKQTNSDLVIINESRVFPLAEDIRRCLDKYDLKARIFDADQINGYVVKQLNLTEDGKEFSKNYTMGMNIEAQYYLLTHPKSPYEKILYFDDDVLINADLCNIFKNYKFGFAKNMLGYTFTKDLYAQRLAEIYGAGPVAWKQNHINSGQRLYHREIEPIYKWILELFYNEPLFKQAWENYKAGISGYKMKGFFIDQNFENCVGFRGKILNSNLNQHVRILNGMKLPKDLGILRNKELTHYAVGSKESKMQLLKMLKEGGHII